jgi:hypothetical protein
MEGSKGDNPDTVGQFSREVTTTENDSRLS